MIIYKYNPIMSNKEKYFKTAEAAIECARKDVIEFYRERGTDIIFDRTENMISSTTSETTIYVYFNRADTNQLYICAYIKLCEVEE